MNTADRSIALVDHALRRSFAFIRLAPNYEILLRFLRNSGYQLDGLIEDIRRMEIEPYLEEFFFDQRDKLSRFRWDAIKGRVTM